MPSAKSSRRDRVRIVLAAVLVIMFLLLIALGTFFVRVLRPPDAVGGKRAARAGSITWVRSLYGYGPRADQQLGGPAAVAIAPDGTIYATDPRHRRVMAFAPDGSFRRLIGASMDKGKLVGPVGVACDGRGNVYVSDARANRIVVYGTDGRYAREFPVLNVMGIGVYGDKLYALAGSGKVHTFTLNGQKLSTWGSVGRKPEQLVAVYGIASDGQSLFIGDANNNAVKAFDPSGKLLWIRSGKGGSIDSSASMTATEAAGNEVQIPQGTTIDGAGRLVAVDAFSFKMLVLDRKDGQVKASYGSAGSGEGQFMYATGIAYDPARDWFAVADTMNDRVQIVRIPGSGGGIGSAAARALSSPFRICAVPLVLLLLALGILATWRRREKDGDGEHVPEEMPDEERA